MDCFATLTMTVVRGCSRFNHAGFSVTIQIDASSSTASGITSPGNFHIDHVDPRGRFALPEFFVGRRCAQAEQCFPFRSAEDAGEGAAAGDFNALQLAPAAVEAN